MAGKRNDGRRRWTCVTVPDDVPGTTDAVAPGVDITTSARYVAAYVSTPTMTVITSAQARRSAPMLGRRVQPERALYRSHSAVEPAWAGPLDVHLGFSA